MVCPHRLASLKEVIIPGREKEDQAGFLISAATYIRQLQVVIPLQSRQFPVNMRAWPPGCCPPVA